MNERIGYVVMSRVLGRMDDVRPVFYTESLNAAGTFVANAMMRSANERAGGAPHNETLVFHIEVIKP